MSKHLIYLAAGSGRRFGGNKLLYPLEERPLFSYGLETLRRAAQLRPQCEVTVVSRYPEILEAAQTAGVRAVDSPQSVGGISHTIRAALDALPPVSGEDFLFFAVADQPWLEADTLLRLVDAARPGVPGGTVAFGERVGSPTFFLRGAAPRAVRPHRRPGGAAHPAGAGAGLRQGSGGLPPGAGGPGHPAGAGRNFLGHKVIKLCPPKDRAGQREAKEAVRSADGLKKCRYFPAAARRKSPRCAR